jgi:hypothetical protein
MDATLLIFNWREFRRKWGLRGVKGKHPGGTLESEFHYGICEKLKRHKYLRPYHTSEYGLGNLLKDGERPVLWHQWYGSYRKRLAGSEHEPTVRGNDETIAMVHTAQEKFLRDYPNLDFSGLTPAWGPDCDLELERVAVANSYPSLASRGLDRMRRWRSYGARGLSGRFLLRLDRWRRLYLSRNSSL